MLPLAPIAQAADSDKQDSSAVPGEDRHWRLELKRQNTDRGTPEETTKTTVRISRYLDGFVSRLRLEVPFPDENTGFGGAPFDPRLGDIEVRAWFRPFHIDSLPLTTFFAITFPTASPENLGSGKYQLKPGIETKLPIPLSEEAEKSQALTFEPQIKQVFSVAGDPDRKNINYTQIELALKDTWKKKYWVKLNPKPTIDWEHNASTGAVLELEVGWTINHSWSVWLMGGTLLWGEGVPGTYDRRVELSVAFQF